MENITTPFFGAREVRQGRLTRRQLLTDHQQVLPGVYLPRAIEIDAVHRAHAAWVWSKGRAVLTGRSAAMIEMYDERGLNRCQAHIGWRRERVAVQCFELGSPAEFENLNTLVQHGWLAFALHACPDRTASAEFGAFLGHRVRCALLSRAADLR